MELSEDQINSLKLLNKIINSISLIPSLLIILMYLKQKNRNNFCLEFSLHLSLCTIISCISSFLDNLDRKSLACLISSMLLIFSNFKTIFWLLLIGYTAQKQIQKISFIEENIIKIRIIYYLIGFGIPFIICVM